MILIQENTFSVILKCTIDNIVRALPSGNSGAMFYSVFPMSFKLIVFLSCRVAHQALQVRECLPEAEVGAEDRATGGLQEER